MTVTILLGDVRDRLRSLPPDSFDCVVTSIPYWGLRDYGTGRWEGGDPNCDHRSPTMRLGRDEQRASLAGSVATNSAQLRLAHRSACGKCGAVKVDHQIGLEATLAEYLAVMIEVFQEVRRVVKDSGSVWLNSGDCYATSPNGRSAAATKAAGTDDRTFRDKPFSTIGGPLKAKDLAMIPNRLAIALQQDGWWVRSEIIWAKPNPMPESIKDRPGTSHEKIFLLTKSPRYHFDAVAVAQIATSDHASGNGFVGRQGGAEHLPMSGGAGSLEPWLPGGFRNVRNYERAPLAVWEIPTQSFREAHFATFPPELVERCLKAGCPRGGTVLDPFGGAGTTALVADQMQLDCTIIELNPDYVHIAVKRIETDRGALQNALDPLQIDLLEGAA